MNLGVSSLLREGVLLSQTMMVAWGGGWQGSKVYATLG